MTAEEARRSVDDVVYQLGFGLIAFGHSGEAAVFLQPFQDQVHHVDRESRRCVIEGIFLGMDVVAQHGRNVFRAALNHILAQDDQSNPCRAEVFLGARIDHGKLGGVKRTAEHVRGHVGNQRRIAKGGELLPFGAVDGVIGGKVHIGWLFAEFDFFHFRNALVIAVGRSRGNMGIA